MNEYGTRQRNQPPGLDTQRTPRLSLREAQRRARETTDALILYPRRLALLGLAVIGILLAPTGCLIMVARLLTLIHLAWLGLPLILCVFVFFWPIGFAFLWRAIWRPASLIIWREGVFDNATLLISGVGFIPWEQISTIRPGRPRTSQRIDRLLISVEPETLTSIWRRQPLVKQVLRLLLIGGAGVLWVPPGQLATPAPEALAQIARLQASWAHEPYRYE